MGSFITPKNGMLKFVDGQISMDTEGNSKPVLAGDTIPEGAVLLVADNTRFELVLDDGTTLDEADAKPEADPQQAAQPVDPNAINDIDPNAINEIEALQAQIAAGGDPTADLPETAAGVATAGSEGNSGYVSLARAGSETLASSGYDTTGTPLATDSGLQEPQQPGDYPTQALNDSVTVEEGSVASGNVLANDTDIDSSLSVFSFEVNGGTFTAGTAVTLEGGVLVINADGSYTFTPNDNWNGTVPTVTYTTNTGATATLTINVTPVDDPTITADDSVTVSEGTVASGNVLDNDSDIDSDLSVASFTVNGTTAVAGTSITLEGGVLLINADGSYTFTPNDNWNGTVPTVTYTTNTGATATLTINVTPVDDPTITADDSVTVSEGTVASGNVLDNDTDIDSELSVASFTVNGTTAVAGTSVTLEGGVLVINADGSYTFTPNDNWNGTVPTVTYTTNTGATATLTINVTPVGGEGPNVVINTDADNDGFINNQELGDSTTVNVTIDITPTGAIAGDTLTVNGTQIVLTQTDIDNGFVNLDLPSPGEGQTITVVATVTDQAGNVSPEGSDSAVLDTIPPVITVDAPDNTNDTTPTITGTTDAEPGSTVTIVVTDVNGGTQTLTTTVNQDGTYAVDVVTPLPEGGYTADASVTDPAGNTGTDTDDGSVDVTAPVITVEAPDNTTDDTPTITGTTDAAPGSTITIVITDSNGGTQTLTTTVNEDGSYAVDVASPLPEGGYTADASVTDTAGNTGTDSDNGDVVYPEVSISANQTDVSEGDTASFTVSLSQAATEDITVNFTYSGTAVDGTDFTGVVSVVIPAGQTSVIVNINTIDDVYAEGSEDFTITIGNVSGGNATVGGNNSATTNIVDEAVPGEEDTVSVTLTGPGSVTEGETTGSYTVTLSDPAPVGSIVTLSYSYTSASGEDIIETVQAVIGADGKTATFTITTVDDVYAEGDEAFTVSVSGIQTPGGSNVFEQLDLTGASVTTTIKDAASPTDPEVPGEEDTVTVTLTGPGSVTEGETTGSYTVTLSEPAPAGSIVTLSYSYTTASGEDIIETVQAVIGADGKTATFTITTVDDVYAEGDEAFTVSVSGIQTPGGSNVFEQLDLTGASVTTTIKDAASPTDPEVPGEEDTVTVTLTGPGSVTEGEVTGSYTVTLSEPAPVGSIVTLSYSYTTASGEDIIETVQAVIGADGKTATFTITTVDDVYAEGDEAFTVSVSGITVGGNNVFEQLDLTGASVTTTIKDAASPTDPEVPSEEDTVTVTLTGPGSVTEGEVTGSYTVTLSEPAPVGSIVTLSYSYTTASGEDIIETVQAVIGADGKTATFTITTVDDVYAEGDEAFTVSVSGITVGGNNVFEQLDLTGASVTTTIKDAASPVDPEVPGEEDTVTVTLTGPGSVTEGETTGSYTVTLSEPAPVGSIVTLSYSYTTASGEDIIETVQAVIGADGKTATFTITTVDDVYAEGDEAFTVS
ncbi:retention module-containing protein, partial [Shewanella sp. JM162201]